MAFGEKKENIFNRMFTTVKAISLVRKIPIIQGDNHFLDVHQELLEIGATWVTQKKETQNA